MARLAAMGRRIDDRRRSAERETAVKPIILDYFPSVVAGCQRQLPRHQPQRWRCGSAAGVHAATSWRCRAAPSLRRVPVLRPAAATRFGIDPSPPPAQARRLPAQGRPWPSAVAAGARRRPLPRCVGAARGAPDHDNWATHRGAAVPVGHAARMRCLSPRRTCPRAVRRAGPRPLAAPPQAGPGNGSDTQSTVARRKLQLEELGWGDGGWGVEVSSGAPARAAPSAPGKKEAKAAKTAKKGAQPVLVEEGAGCSGGGGGRRPACLPCTPTTRTLAPFRGAGAAKPLQPPVPAAKSDKRPRAPYMDMTSGAGAVSLAMLKKKLQDEGERVGGVGVGGVGRAKQKGARSQESGVLGPASSSRAPCHHPATATSHPPSRLTRPGRRRAAGRRVCPPQAR
jgi:hypothetical protein